VFVKFHIDLPTEDFVLIPCGFTVSDQEQSHSAAPFFACRRTWRQQPVERGILPEVRDSSPLLSDILIDIGTLLPPTNPVNC
jgi:hypothetical protein